MRFPNRTCKQFANEAGFGRFQHALYNTPVQRTAADITKKALGLLPQRLADTGAQIIGTVHDEIILEVPEGIAND
ncbi:MAG: DNA polymerase [Syntrophobacteraceae bacterium]